MRRFLVEGLKTAGEVAGAVALVILLIFLVGFPVLVGPSRYEQGSAIRYAFPWWVVLPVLAGSAGALVLCWLWRKNMTLKMLALLLLLGLGLPALQLPAVVYNYVRIEDSQFESCLGMTGDMTTLQVRFEDLKEVCGQYSVNAEGTVSARALLLSYRSGKIEKLQSGVIVTKQVMFDVMQRARARGVPVREEKVE